MHEPGLIERAAFRTIDTIVDLAIIGGGCVGGAALFIGAGYGIFGEKGLDILGDKGSPRPPQEVKAEALKIYKESYEKRFRAADPVGKFALQFTDESKMTVEVRNLEDDGHGLSKPAYPTYESIVVGNEPCFEGTTYDLSDSRSSASAQTDPRNLSVLKVTPSTKNTPALELEGLKASQLTPTDKTSENILETYGCDNSPKILGHSK